MCKKSETTKKETVPGHISDAGKYLTARAMELSQKPFQSYTGNRVANTPYRGPLVEVNPYEGKRTANTTYDKPFVADNAYTGDFVVNNKYGADMTAGLTADQQSAFQKIRDMIAGAPQVAPAAMQGAFDYGTAGPQQVGTERVVDEGGKLGRMSDYLDPQMRAAEGPVQSALRKIQEQADAQRKRIGANATTAGSFGDARHGVVEGVLGRDTSLATGETAGNMYGAAYDKAMAQRTGDVNRFLGVDTANANFAETALDRKLAGSKAVMDFADQDQRRELGLTDALAGAGREQQASEDKRLAAQYAEFLRGEGLSNEEAKAKYGEFTRRQEIANQDAKAKYGEFLRTQGIEQKDLDAKYEEFLRQQGLKNEGNKATYAEFLRQQGLDQAQLDAGYQDYLMQYQHQFSLLDALSKALMGQPYDKTTTSTQPDNSLLGLGGSVIGGIFGGPAGAAIGGKLMGAPGGPAADPSSGITIGAPAGASQPGWSQWLASQGLPQPTAKSSGDIPYGQGQQLPAWLNWAQY